MLKRLLTAVLVLGLLLAFCGTAFTDPSNVPGGGEGGRQHPSPAYTGRVHGQLLKLPVPVMRHSGERILETGTIPPRPAPAGVDTAACYEPENYSGTARYRVELFTGTMPDDTDNSLAEMFSVVNYPKYHVTVDRVDAIIRIARHYSAGGTGPGLRVRVRVHDDNMGLPGAVLHSEVFTIPAEINAGTWFTFPFSAPVAIPGSRYHVSIGYDPTQAADGDNLALWVALNGPSWCSFGASGTWIPLADSWWGTGEDLVLVPHQCEFYSSCFNERTPLGTGAGYIHPMPDNVGWTGGATVNGVGQRFVAAQPETITQVRVAHYSLPGYYTGTSTNGLVVQIWNDDGTGSIDNAAGPISTTTVPGGAGLFPTTGIGGTGWNYVDVHPSPMPVVRGPWHVTMKCSSDLPADGQIIFWYSNPVSNPGPSGLSVGMSAPFSPYWQRSYLNTDWGFDAGNNVRVYLCKDEFSICGVNKSYFFGSTRWLYMDNCDVTPHYGTRNGIAGHFIAGKFNRVEKIRFQIDDEVVDGYPNVNSKLKVSICAPDGSNVGTVLWTTTLDEALGQMTMSPGWTEVVIPGGLIVVNEWYITLEPILTLDGDNEWLYFGRERVGDDPSITAIKNGGMYVKLCADNLWYQNTPAIGGSGTDNAVMEADICSIPPDRWTCGTPTDFNTATADFARTSHTSVPLSDAYCDLSLKWKYVDPLYNIATNRIGNSGPVVYNDIVVCGFASRYRFFSLTDGHVMGEIAGTGTPYYLPTSGMNSTPTIAMVNVGGTPKPVMFVGGGVSTGFRTFAAYDLSSWTGAEPNAVPTQLWILAAQGAFNNYAAHGFTFPVGMSQHIGNTSWTNPVVTQIGGVDAVIFNTNDQYVWAANAATGNRIWGPIIINGLTYKGMALVGGALYITNTPLLPTYPLGDITKWDAQTGNNIWKLSTAPGGGLKGASVGQDFGNETFVSGLALWPEPASVEVYAVSTTPEIDDPSGAVGGLLYRINGGTGAVLGTTLTKHVRQDGGLATIAGVMVDANVLVVAGSSRWAFNGDQLFGYNRFTGAQIWSGTEGNATDNGHLYDGLLTCEAGETDLGFVTNTGGYLTCFNPITGNDIFSRRFNNAANRGGTIGISKEGDLLVADRNGSLFCLSKQIDRPRLEIINYTPQGNTYGPLNSVPMTIPNVFTNTGCATLTGTITYSTVSNGSTLGGVPALKAAGIADQLTQESNSKMMLVAKPNFMNSSETTTPRPALNPAASAIPPFLNVGTQTFTLLPGGAGNLELDVHQSLVYRGANVFFAWFNSNDEDYFLDSAGATRIDPQIRGQIVGGCLLDTATLHFGAGGANLQWVLNVPRMGHFGETDNPFVNIAGNTADFYGGFYIYGVSLHRIAMNTQDWWSGGGESQAYKALQGDPNECTTNCKPALLASQTFGLITTNGASYAPLTGNLVCRTYLDSVQMWAPLDTAGVYGTWNWNNTWLTAGTYNNDSTMGLVTTSRSIGFMDPPFPELNFVVVDFMKIFQRYEGADPVLNWRMGEWIDYDLGGDTILFWPSVSACASVPANGTRIIGAFGTIKLPYGGGCNSTVYPSMKNALSLEGNQSMNANAAAVHGNAYFDSVYYFMGLNTTNFSQGPMRTAPGDQRSHDTWITHDFMDNTDTLRFAIAHYGNPAVANPRDPNSLTAPLSRLLNKWVGMDRGDVNNDGAVNLADIVYLADYAAYGSATAAHPGPIPFVHVGDVNADDAVNGADVTYLVNYYFHYGACPMSKYIAY